MRGDGKARALGGLQEVTVPHFPGERPARGQQDPPEEDHRYGALLLGPQMALPQDTEAENQRWSSQPMGLKDKFFLVGHTQTDEGGLDLQWTPQGTPLSTGDSGPDGALP